MKKVTVALVDDHGIIRDGLVALFEDHTEIDIRDNFDSGMGLLNALQTNRYDLILLDMHMPVMDGIATAKEVLRLYPNTRILIHTMSEIISEIEQVVSMGIQGYILKTAGQEELAMAIKTVAHGSSFFSSSVMNSFIKSCIKESENPLGLLNPNEMQVLRLLADDKLSQHQISVALALTEDQLKNIIYKIKKTLQTDTDFALGKFCAVHFKEIAEYKTMA